MEANNMAFVKNITIVMLLSFFSTIHGTYGNEYQSQWKQAHATFYGGNNALQVRGCATTGGITGGACGYFHDDDSIYRHDYGPWTVALSTTLFNNGSMCGACYEIECYNDPQWCLPERVLVTATNFCPPNNSLPNDNGGWCNPPLDHFDMTEPAFLRIAKYKSGIVPVLYRRVPCKRPGGIRFTMLNNKYFVLVLVSNVGGDGSVSVVAVRGSTFHWQETRRSWGQNWHTDTDLIGQNLSFKVTTTDGRAVVFRNLVRANWQFNQTFEGGQF